VLVTFNYSEEITYGNQERRTFENHQTKDEEEAFKKEIISLTIAPNKSLDASGGSVFRIMTGPAMLE